jgi:hypothetical protein
MAEDFITARGLQGAVAIVTARLAGLDIPQAQILGETPPAEALHALSVVVVAVLGVATPVGLQAALRSAGVFAGEMEAAL